MHQEIFIVLLSVLSCCPQKAVSEPIPESYFLESTFNFTNYTTTSKLGRFIGPSREGSAAGEKTVITVLNSVPYTSIYFPLGPLATEPMRYAIDKLQTLPNWLPNYEIVFETLDDLCENDAAITELGKELKVNNATNRFPFVLLNDCTDLSQLVTASFIKEYNFIGMTVFINIYRLFEDHHKFPNYFSVINRPDIYYLAMLQMFKAVGWNKVALVSEIEDYVDKMDSYLFHLLDQFNITVPYLGKLHLATDDEGEMAEVFDMFKARDARIFISQALNTASMACWFHRYGMFGPKYAIFLLSWNALSEFSEPPDYWPWCTKDMLMEVIPSMYGFGDGTLADVKGSETADILGTRLSDLRDHLTTIIDDAEEQAWIMDYWSPMYYDRALFAGLVLNKTESLLQSRNETLIDWVTSTAKYQENGSQIANLVREAITSVQATCLKGEYQFNITTGLSDSYIPIVFTKTQVSKDQQTGEYLTSPYFFGYYKSNEGRIIFINSIDWGTVDGLPPVDSITFVSIKRPVFSSEALEYFFQTLAGILILVSLCLIAWACVKRKDFTTLPIFLGNIIILIHIFVVARLEQLHFMGCQTVVTLIVIGYSSINMGIAERMNAFCLQVTAFLEGDGNNTVFHRACTCVTSKPGLATLLWCALQLAFLAIFFVVVPSEFIKPTIANLSIELFSTNANFAYKPYLYECSVSVEQLIRHPAIAFLGLVGAMQVALLFKLGIMSYTIYSHRKRIVIPVELKRVYYFVYCQILIIVCGFFVGSLNLSSGHHLQMVTTSITLCIVLLDTPFSASLIPKSDSGPPTFQPMSNRKILRRKAKVQKAT